jgi:hypothetical protein
MDVAHQTSDVAHLDGRSGTGKWLYWYLGI